MKDSLTWQLHLVGTYLALRRTSWNVGKISSYQVQLSRKRTFHHFMSTGATEKSLHAYYNIIANTKGLSSRQRRREGMYTNVHVTTWPSKIQILSKNHNCAAREYTVYRYSTARQCSRNSVNHTLHCSTPYHYKVYLVYPASHLNFARCTRYIHGYMPSHRLRWLDKPLMYHNHNNNIIYNSCTIYVGLAQARPNYIQSL